MTDYRPTALPGACCKCGRYVEQEKRRAYETYAEEWYGVVEKTMVVCVECLSKDDTGVGGSSK